MNPWVRYGQAVTQTDRELAPRLERRLRQRLDAAHGERRARRQLLRWGAAVVAAAAAFVLVWATAIHRPAPLQAVRVHTGARAQEVSLPHQGQLLVAANSDVELQASPETGAVVELRRGEVTLRVHRAAGNRWRVRSGPYEVEALGTKFRVRWTPAVPDVSVEEGVVLLTGPSLPADGVRIRAEKSSDEIAEARSLPVAQSIDDASAATSEVKQEIETKRPDPAVKRSPRPRWVNNFRAANKRGDSEAAVAALPFGFPNASESLRISDLLDAGDALAAQGDRRADSAYARVCARAPRSRTCGIATFRRALLQARGGNKNGAVEMATRYLESNPQGSLARECLGRRMQWRWELGLRKAAHADAARYLERWPQGPHRRLATRISGT